MSCCEPKQSVKEFVVSKAKNMRQMLEPYVKTDEHKAILNQYKETDIADITHKYLMPLYATGTLDVAKLKLIEELSITDDATKDKIGRYLQCFCESLFVKS